MTKIIEVEECGIVCPHHGYNEGRTFDGNYCRKKGCWIQSKSGEIPEWCPLKDKDNDKRD